MMAARAGAAKVVCCEKVDIFIFQKQQALLNLPNTVTRSLTFQNFLQGGKTGELC